MGVQDIDIKKSEEKQTAEAQEILKMIAEEEELQIMFEAIGLIAAFVIVFLKKGFLSGLFFLIMDWLIVGNIIRYICGENPRGYFLFAAASLALAYFYVYIVR